MLTCHSSEGQSRSPGIDQQSESIKMPAKRKSNENVKKRSTDKPRRKKVRKESTSEESSEDSSSDESVEHSLAVKEHGLNAIENISTAESDLLDELMLFCHNKF